VTVRARAAGRAARLFPAFLLLGAACATAAPDGPPKAAPGPAAERTGEAGQGSPPTALPTRAASDYEAPGSPPHAEGLALHVEKAIADVAARNGRRLVADARLSAAARDLAAGLGPSGSPPMGVVEFALRRHGVIEPPPHLVSAILSGGVDEPALFGDLERQLPPVLGEGRYNRFGVGIDQEGRQVRLVLALGESFVQLERVPRAPALGTELSLRGSLLAPFHSPELLVTGPSGAVSHPALVREGAGFRALVSCRQAGRYQVEITGEDTGGQQVLANFPVWCGMAPPAAPPSGLVEARIDTPAQAEARCFELVNLDRAHYGLPPLSWDGRLADVGRAHSQDMHDHDFVGHNSPRTGAPADRLRRAGQSAAVMLENVARAYSPEEIEQGLMDSPGHRANILSREATHLGIGIVFGREVAGRREMFATQVFVRRPPLVDPQAAARALMDEIARRRQRAGVAPPRRDALLDQAAATFSREVATGRARRDQVGRAGDQAVASGHGRFHRVSALFTVVAEASQLPESPDLLAPGTAVGVGIAIGSAPDLGEGVLYVTLLVGWLR
jgi:uncharacterized protein YkwD